MGYQIIDTGVVILGSGGGGLRAAIAAGRSGADTALVGKGKIDRSGATLLAGANVSADIGCDGGSLARMGIDRSFPEDTPEKWFEDLVREGFFLNEQTLVQMYVGLAPRCLEEMIAWGMPVQGMEGSRAVSVPSTGILDCLYSQVKKLGVKEFADVVGLDLIIHEGRAAGVLALDLIRGELLLFRADAVVIATGGAHGLYRLNSGSSDLTGDGQAMAFRAGAEMVDMEMVSFLPTTVLYPVLFRGNILPYILSTLGYGEILNGSGEPFIEKHYSGKTADAAQRSEWNKLLLSRAIFEEMQTHPTPHGGVAFSMKKTPPADFRQLRNRFPGLSQDPYKSMLKILEDGQALEIAPAGHYFEGGIRINHRCESSIPGLYAAGECTGGLFGANRVAAATTEMVIEGLTAGEEAAKYAGKAESRPDLQEAVRDSIRFYRAGGVEGRQAAAARIELQEKASRFLGIKREENGLQSMEAYTRELSSLAASGLGLSGKRYDLMLLERIILRNLVDCAGLIARASSERKESRGVFYRADFPITDNDRYLRHVTLCRKEGGVLFTMEEVASTGLKLPSGRYAYEDFLTRIVEEVT